MFLCLNVPTEPNVVPQASLDLAESSSSGDLSMSRAFVLVVCVGPSTTPFGANSCVPFSLAARKQM